MLSVLTAAVMLAASSEQPKLFVMDLKAAGGVEAEVATAMTEWIADRAASRGIFTVVSSKDLQTALGLERQRQLVGCSDDSTSCFTELAGALGARFVLSGSLARLGDVYQLTLQTYDSGAAKPIGRSTRIARDLAQLRLEVPGALAEATATPLPPEPSRAPGITLVAAGGAVLLGAGVGAMLTFAEEGALQRELERGAENRAALKPLSAYQQDAQRIGLQKTVVLIATLAGAALAAGGVIDLLLISGTPGGVALQWSPLAPTAFAVSFP